jgi:hypothetical protein
MEIDFRFLHKICAVGTMGKDGDFMELFYVSYSKDGSAYTYSSVFGERFVSRNYSFLSVCMILYNHVS